MKLQNVRWLSVTALTLFLIGCAHPHYDPSLNSEPSKDVIKVVSLTAEPAKPIAPEPWRVTMKIKNISGQPVEDLTYKFFLGGKGDKLGEGKIARLDPGATVSVTSEVAKVENGTYRVEGRVFLKNAKGEPEFTDRMNNWMGINVVVAQ